MGLEGSGTVVRRWARPPPIGAELRGDFGCGQDAVVPRSAPHLEASFVDCRGQICPPTWLGHAAMFEKRSSQRRKLSRRGNNYDGNFHFEDYEKAGSWTQARRRVWACRDRRVS